MNAVHLHLLLNHVPVLGTLFGLLLLLAALAWRSDAVRRAAMGLFLVAALTAIPVYLTGEPAEDAVENSLGVTENYIEAHEEAAGIALGGTLALGVLSLAGLILFRGDRKIPGWFATTTLAGAIIVTGLMGYTANLGGQIRHTEIRADAPAVPHKD